MDSEDLDSPAVIADPVDHTELIKDRGHLAYIRPARGLYLLREYILGPERFDAAFRDYFEAWAFHSPQPSDFFHIVENASGRDLSWFWRGWFLENRSLDQRSPT